MILAITLDYAIQRTAIAGGAEVIEARDGASPLPDEWDEMAHHPAFDVAVRRFAAGLLDMCDTDARMAAVCKDAGRYVVAMSAIFLHTAGGLDLPTLKRISADTSILSAGRTRAVVDFLIHIGYLSLETSASGEPRYCATPDFRLAWRRQLQVLLTAASEIDPDLQRLIPRLDESSDVFDRFVLVQASRLHALSRRYVASPALEQAFLHPYAGSQILYVLTPMPVDEPLTVRISGLASRFAVTQIHVRRLLRRAHDEGFIVYEGHGRLRRTRAGKAIIDQHYAMQLSELVGVSRQLQLEGF